MKKLQFLYFKTTHWSGGTTTELFIFPEGSDFKKGDFLYRLSIATVQVSSSDFTPLKDVNRTLLLLEGELKLIHENHHESFLMPFSQDVFSGNWNTHCIGIGKDFNLMTKGNCKGKVSVFKNDYTLQSKADQILIYCYEGSCKINEDQINEQELFKVTNTQNIHLEDLEGVVIVVEIFL